MTTQARSGAHPQPYLSKIAQHAFLNSQRATPNQSPSKTDQDPKTNTKSTLADSSKNVAAADRFENSPGKPANSASVENEHNVQPQSQVNSTERGSLKKTQSNCVLDDDDFHRTKSKLFDANFSHHDPNLCVCSSCNCGRHLCKLHVVKPDLHINTIYRGDFKDKQPLGPLSYRPRSSKKADGPHIDMKSIYGKQFIPKGSDLERPHPEDLLGVGGPSTNITTYGSGFPGYRGVNQYVNTQVTQVKPTNNTSLNGLIPFNGNSVYKHSYGPKRGRSSDPYRFNDTLKVGQTWMGSTTYRDNFRQPLEGYNTPFNPESRKADGPGYAHQFGTEPCDSETTYKNDFIGKTPGLCPAKVQLETRSKGFFNDSKVNFNENSDFKSMNPEFHAIATSKHSYV